MKRLCLAMLMLAAAGSAAEKSDLIKHIEASKAFSLDVANAMPPSGYAFKAEDKVQPPDRTFGEIMVHIGSAVNNYCGSVSGVKAADAPAATNRDAVAAFIGQAFDACVAAVQKEDGLDRMVKRGTSEMTAREVFWGMLLHTAHHRGQVEVYLRLQGVKPPAYRF